MANQQSSLNVFGLIPAIAVAAGAVVALALSVLVLQSQVNAGHREAVGQQIANEIAQQINMKEAQIKSQLSKIATSSFTITAISGSNTDIIEAEATIGSLITFAERVRLIPNGSAKTDQGFPPFNFTALDLVKRSEAGELPPPEAISAQPQLEGDKWIIVATPVQTRDGSSIGTLFVYLNTQSLSAGLTESASGEVRILQTVGTAPKPIAMIGSNEGNSLYEAALNNPSWSMQYSPSNQIADNTPMGILLYLLPALAMLVISLAGVVFGSNQAGSKLKANLSTLGLQISRVADGGLDPRASYSLPGFDEADALLEGLALPTGKKRPAPAKSKASAKITAAEQAVVEEEIVEIEMIEQPNTYAEADVEELEVDDFDEVVRAANESGDSSAEADAIEHIFRACDIRGVVGESLSENIARKIGLAIGSEALARGETSLLVGYDGREYSPALAEALMEGIAASGRDVINIGSVPTPVLYYATNNSDTTSGVMVTGSHNPPEYNGFKVVLGGKSLVEEEFRSLFERVRDSNFSEGAGQIRASDFTQDYMDAIADDVVVAQPLKVVIDCANGIAGAIAPELLDSLGCEAVPLYCEVDGSFPNHNPDPTRPENLQDLIKTVRDQGADLGIAIDGDGDRLVAITAEGDIVWPDRLLMLFAKDIVSRNPGSDVVYDVKCTRHLNSVISGFGGRPIICRSGHSFVKQKISETDAVLGGEFSGHICFSERWFGFDDGLYSAARLLEIVGSQEEGLSELLAGFPESVSTPEIHIAVDDKEKFGLITRLIETADFEDATLTTIDGLRVDFSDGWGLVRASNTQPAISLRFEADNNESLEDIKGAFQELLQEVRGDLDITL